MKMSPFRFGHKFPSVISLQAFIIVAAVMWILHIAAANEQTHQRLKNPETKGIQITSDKLVAKINDGEIIYTGNVKALQAGIVVTSEHLRIIYDPDTAYDKDGSLKAEAIRKIIARGRVKIIYGNIIAEADKAVYTIKSAVIILTGNPSRITRDGHVITGSKFTLQRSDGSLTVEGDGHRRVKAILNPD